MRLNGLRVITDRSDFQYSKQFGLPFFSKSVVLQVSSPVRSTTINSVGFIVSKKVGKAVTRNLIKRRLRVVAEQLLVGDKSRNYVLIARKDSVHVTFQSLRRDVLLCLNRANNKLG